jgi:hypothetical protein
MVSQSNNASAGEEPANTGVTTPELATAVTTPELATAVTTPELATRVTTLELATRVTTSELAIGVTTPELAIGDTTPELATGVTTPELAIHKDQSEMQPEAAKIGTTSVSSPEAATTEAKGIDVHDYMMCYTGRFILHAYVYMRASFYILLL